MACVALAEATIILLALSRVARERPSEFEAYGGVGFTQGSHVGRRVGSLALMSVGFEARWWRTCALQCSWNLGVVGAESAR